MSSPTPSTRSPRRLIRGACAAVAAVALCATVGLHLDSASASPNAATDGVSVSAMGHNPRSAAPDPWVSDPGHPVGWGGGSHLG